jgi:hypothetical protein
MRFLYASKKSGPLRLVATFDSEQQLRAYVNWATLEGHPERPKKFEQGSALASYDAWEESALPLNENVAGEVPHNPSPSML